MTPVVVARGHSPVLLGYVPEEIRQQLLPLGQTLADTDWHIHQLYDGLLAGRLPDFGIGTNEGTTCDPQVEATVLRVCKAATGYSTTLNGRFRGGWTTRHYGQPQSGIHTIQMELAQPAYLAAERPPWAYDAARLRQPLGDLLENLADLALTTGDLT